MISAAFPLQVRNHERQVLRSETQDHQRVFERRFGDRLSSATSPQPSPIKGEGVFMPLQRRGVRGRSEQEL